MLWSFLLLFKPSLIVAQTKSIEQDFLTAATVAEVIALATFLLFRAPLSRLIASRWAAPAACCACLLATMSFFAAASFFSGALLYAGALCVGCGSSVLLLRIGAILARNQEKLLVELTVGFAVSLTLGAALLVTPAPVGQAAALASLVAHGALSFALDENGPRAGDAPDAPRSDRIALAPGLFKALFCVFLFRFESACLVVPFRTNDTPGDSWVLSVSIALSAAVAVGSIAISRLSGDRFPGVLLYRALAFFALVGLAAIPLSLDPSIYYGIEVAFYALLKILVLLLALRLADQLGLSPLVVVASSQLVLDATGLASTLLFQAMPFGNLFWDEQAPAIAFVLVVLILFTYLFLFTEHDVIRVFEKSRKLTAAEILERRCLRVAQRYALSPRETEVLTLLTQGRSARYIASNLYLSQGTVNMYLHKVYKKLNVHSKQEALDIVEAIEGE